MEQSGSLIPRGAVATTIKAISVSVGVMVGYAALIIAIPATAPGLWYIWPISTFAGFTVLWNRYPKDAYPIGLAYFLLIGLLNFFIAALVWWKVLGGYI
jgi:hypothetical protein